MARLQGAASGHLICFAAAAIGLLGGNLWFLPCLIAGWLWTARDLRSYGTVMRGRELLRDAIAKDPDIWLTRQMYEFRQLWPTDRKAAS